MGTKGQITLLNFFVFNPTLGPREGEEEKKIMFYYPSNTDIDTKIKHIGLCEAIVKFTETFSDKACNSMHTQKTRQLYLEAEKDFWFVMTVSIPFDEKSKDGNSYQEFHDDDVQDHVFSAVLNQSYRMFQLFNGTISSILNRANNDIRAVQVRLEHFFSRYLQTLNLDQADILDVFSGIHFLPLDKSTYLQIQCFINQLEAQFSNIKYTAFLYNDQLVWSGLEQDDMRIVYKYLTTSLFPTYLEQELKGGGNSFVSPSRSTSSSPTIHYGKFITGPPNIKDESKLGKIPVVYLKKSSSQEMEECHLLVYRAHNASICMFIQANLMINFELCKMLDMCLGPQLTQIASDIAEPYSKKTTSSADGTCKYIYFNHMNLAQKSTIHLDNRKTHGAQIPNNILRMISDISCDMSRFTDDGETIVKNVNDAWLVGKKSDSREFYVVMNQKNTNLIEINDEVKRVCSSNFNSIFFLD